LTPQQTFSFTFTVPGSYPYFCEIHGAQMTGTITVQYSNRQVLSAQ